MSSLTRRLEWGVIVVKVRQTVDLFKTDHRDVAVVVVGVIVVGVIVVVGVSVVVVSVAAVKEIVFPSFFCPPQNLIE